MLPGVELELGHLHHRALGGEVVREGIGQVAGVALAPEAVHHQVHELDQRVPVEPVGQQLVELAECRLERRVVVAGLVVVEILASPADLDHRHLLPQEIGHGELFRLDVGAGKLDAESHLLPVTAGGIEGQLPDRVPARACPGHAGHRASRSGCRAGRQTAARPAARHGPPGFACRRGPPARGRPPPRCSPPARCRNCARAPARPSCCPGCASPGPARSRTAPGPAGR